MQNQCRLSAFIKPSYSIYPTLTACDPSDQHMLPVSVYHGGRAVWASNANIFSLANTSWETGLAHVVEYYREAATVLSDCYCRKLVSKALLGIQFTRPDDKWVHIGSKKQPWTRSATFVRLMFVPIRFENAFNPHWNPLSRNRACSPFLPQQVSMSCQMWFDAAVDSGNLIWSHNLPQNHSYHTYSLHLGPVLVLLQ